MNEWLLATHYPCVASLHERVSLTSPKSLRLAMACKSRSRLFSAQMLGSSTKVESSQVILWHCALNRQAQKPWDRAVEREERSEENEKQDVRKKNNKKQQQQQA